MKLLNAASRARREINPPGPKLHLGCGKKYVAGWHNVDCAANVRVDEIADLAETWPWADNTYGIIAAHHVLEHLPSVPHFMDEAHRVLRPGGLLHIAVPHYRHPNAWGDATHVRAFTPQSLDIFLGRATHEAGKRWELKDWWCEGGYELPIGATLRYLANRRGINTRIRPGEIQWLLAPVKGA